MVFEPDEILARLERLTQRAWALLTADPRGSAALAQIAVGLNALLDEVRADTGLLPRSRLHAAVDALERLVEAFDVPAGIVPDDSTPTVDVAPEESVRPFLEAFRGEARKRLAGLSLALSGAFESEPGALDQTIGHLHAIRGSAAMLELRAIADLAGAMEEVAVARRRSGRRDWPVRAMLRGFATLEAAVDDPESGYDNIVRGITDELDAHRGPPPNPFEDAPVTGVRDAPLRRRMLVVDDVATIAHSIGLILSELDMPIDVACDGQEALDLLRARPYSLVVSDVAMPRMGGLDLCRAIRADEGLCDIPVVLLTALDRPEERQAGYDAGAQDYIVKGSIGGGELISRVRALLQDAPLVPGRAVEEAPFRRVLVVEDIETIAASIAFILSEGPYEIELAHDGEEALARLRAGEVELVISDLDMPRMGGLELLEKMRADPDLAAVPVVLLTARDSADARSRARAAGAARFLVKGEIGGSALLDVVGRVLEGS